LDFVILDVLLIACNRPEVNKKPRDEGGTVVRRKRLDLALEAPVAHFTKSVEEDLATDFVVQYDLHSLSMGLTPKVCYESPINHG
jgi:hypothetical protein